MSWQWCVLPQIPQGCVLAPRGVCSVWMGQNRTGHTSELSFGQWLTCRSVCRGACPLLCLHPDFHTLPTFRSVRQPGQAKDFVFAPPHSPLPTHGLDIPVSLTLDLILHSASSDILQKPLLNTWLPHPVWAYIPWRHTCLRLMGCELPGACKLWKATYIAVLCILGSVL